MVGTRWSNAGHAVNARDFEGYRVRNGLIDPRAKFVFASGNTGRTAVAAGPVPWGHVEQNNLEAMPPDLFRDGIRSVFVGKQELDRVESCLGGSGKPVEERDLIEHHGEIGCKS